MKQLANIYLEIIREELAAEWSSRKRFLENTHFVSQICKDATLSEMEKILNWSQELLPFTKEYEFGPRYTRQFDITDNDLWLCRKTGKILNTREIITEYYKQQ